MRAHLNSWAAALALAVTTVACSQSDAGITSAVKTKFAADDTVKASQINVDTSDKVVTLSGTVDSQAAKTRALELARETKGVVRVSDQLTVHDMTADVAPAPDAARASFSDAAITASVKTKLLADTSVGGLKIDVDTRDGVVTLTGKVKSQAERDQALRIARESDGVKTVDDKLTVSPR
jgi:osmotically-inducible protein OsmY